MKVQKENAKLIVEYQKNKEKIEELKNKQNELKNEILNQMKTEMDDEFIYHNFCCKAVQKTKVLYDYDKLKQFLTNEQYKDITDISFEVDEDKFREVLKTYPKLKKILSPAIKINRFPNEQKLDEAYKNGDIDVALIKKCCTINKTIEIRSRMLENE